MTRLLGVVLVAGVLVGGGSLSANATVEAPSDDVQMMVKVNGLLTPVDDAIQEGASLHRSASLIDWDQWFGCFSLDNEDDIFALYTFYWNGEVKDVHLRCGNSAWGYKHVRLEHEADWQAKLNGARGAGWNTGWIARDGSWDDMMSASAASTIIWPDYVGGSAVNNTTCTDSTLYFVDVGTGRVVYSFNVISVFANDSDRLINAYPTYRTTC